MKKLTILLSLLFLVGCNTTNLSEDLETIKFDQQLEHETMTLRVVNLHVNHNSNNTITITDSDKIHVEAIANKDLLDYNFRINLENNELIIQSDSDRPFSNMKLDINIHAPIDKMIIEGGFKVNYDEPKTSTLDITLRGAGEFNVSNIENDSVKLKLEGAGEFNLSGHTDQFDAHIEGAGTINALDLESEKASVRIDGAGQIQTFVNQELNATLNGLGDIQYKGDPTLIKSIDGLGSVEKIN